MKTSTEIMSLSKIVGDEKAIELIAKAGFDAWDFSMFNMCRFSRNPRSAFATDHPLSGAGYLSYARKLKKIGQGYGIVCNQSHAPEPSIYPEGELYLKRAIECTAEAGGTVCVIHPENSVSFEDNVKMYRELIPFAKDYGVKIATENMWDWDKETDRASFAICATPESFCSLIDEVGDDFMVACLDIGHAEMMDELASAEGLVRSLGKRLAALHIHDCDRWHDSHQIPFSMNIDFERVVKALKDISYEGYFTLEAVSYLKGYSEDNVFGGLTDLYKSVKRLADMFEA